MMRTMKYDARLETRTRIGKVLLDIKRDLNHIKAKHSTLQKLIMDLQKKIKPNTLILTKADGGNTIVVMDKDDYTKKGGVIYNE